MRLEMPFKVTALGLLMSSSLCDVAPGVCDMACFTLERASNAESTIALLYWEIK
jgi:hypothetical protein